MSTRKYIEDNFENMITDLRKLVACNSVYSEDEKPFGSENRKVLDIALKIFEEKGLRTKNLDYYCGYGEVGEGDEVIGILSHLDIVPAGDGWDSDPFVVTTKNNTLYGRGVADDKGAVITSLYAIKYLLDTGYKFKKRVRLIVGCNEETGSECIKHYVEKEGHVDLGFTPDGNFPGIFAEKGMVHGELIGRNTKIISIVGGDATNIVCKRVNCSVPLNSFNKEKFEKFLNDNYIKYSIENTDTCNIEVLGKAAHASLPDLGINAISYLMEALYNADFNDSFVNFYHKYVGLTKHGELMGFESIKDDITDTSLNIGVAYKKENEIHCTVDIRRPVKANNDQCKELVDKVKDAENEFGNANYIDSLYYDINSPFVQALDKAYRDVTGDYKHQMEAIGGGTYAKSMNNIIAFGDEMPGCTANIHDSNENVSIEDYKMHAMIYIEAIKNLNEV